MNYLIKSGNLFNESNMVPLYKIRGDISSFNRSILNEEDELVYKIEVKEKEDKFLKRVYNILDKSSCMLGKCEPIYPNRAKISQVYNDMNEAHVTLSGEEYFVKMVSTTKYYILDENKHRILRINHRGVDGGWQIEEKEEMSHSEICVFFILCRFLEREKENLFIR